MMKIKMTGLVAGGLVIAIALGRDACSTGETLP